MTSLIINISCGLISAALVAVASLIWNSFFKNLYLANPVAFVVFSVICAAVSLLVGFLAGWNARARYERGKRTEGQRSLRDEAGAGFVEIRGDAESVKKVVSKTDGKTTRRIAKEEAERAISSIEVATDDDIDALFKN